MQHKFSVRTFPVHKARAGYVQQGKADTSQGFKGSRTDIGEKCCERKVDTLTDPYVDEKKITFM